MSIDCLSIDCLVYYLSDDVYWLSVYWLSCLLIVCILLYCSNKCVSINVCLLVCPSRNVCLVYVCAPFLFVGFEMLDFKRSWVLFLEIRFGGGGISTRSFCLFRFLFSLESGSKTETASAGESTNVEFLITCDAADGEVGVVSRDYFFSRRQGIVDQYRGWHKRIWRYWRPREVEWRVWRRKMIRCPGYRSRSSKFRTLGQTGRELFWAPTFSFLTDGFTPHLTVNF